MEKVYFKLLVFCATISLAYSLVCYQCSPMRYDEDYTEDQCEKNQTKEKCTGDDNTCFKIHLETTKGIVREVRGCTTKSDCDESEEICSDKDKREEVQVKKCEIACCVSIGDTPCNSASIASSSEMFMMMVAALGSLKLF